jgi:hypothetical protein
VFNANLIAGKLRGCHLLSTGVKAPKTICVQNHSRSVCVALASAVKRFFPNSAKISQKSEMIRKSNDAADGRILRRGRDWRPIRYGADLSLQSRNFSSQFVELRLKLLHSRVAQTRRNLRFQGGNLTGE